MIPPAQNMTGRNNGVKTFCCINFSSPFKKNIMLTVKNINYKRFLKSFIVFSYVIVFAKIISFKLGFETFLAFSI